MRCMRPYDAFLLISFGGPEGEDEVIPFLENVTRGRNIPRERLAEVGEHYFLFGGVSPINQQCRDLLAAVTADFDANGIELPIYWGNRFWEPMLTDTLAQMQRDGVRRVLALPTSAYCNWSSRTAYREDIERALADLGEDAPEVDLIRPFYDHPGFIDPLVEYTQASLDKLPADQREGVRLLFSAHSIPTAMASGCRIVPTMPPSTNATTTDASHPNVAVFQWAALQRPIRAAWFLGCVSGDMRAPFKPVGAARGLGARRRGARRCVHP